MISDRLYEVAFQFKKTKLWNNLATTQIFAVKLSDGIIGYISIMGMRGTEYGLKLYVGDEGIQSYYKVLKSDPFLMKQAEYLDLFVQQNCLQCMLIEKEDMPEEERDEVLAYTRPRGIKLAGKHAYPRFEKCLPNHIPWILQTLKEQDRLTEALAAAVEMAKMIQERASKNLVIEPVIEPEAEIPMLVVENGIYSLKSTRLPEAQSYSWPCPRIMNDITIASLKKCRRDGVWECKILRLPDPVLDEEGEIPVLPVTLLAVESFSERVLPMASVADYEENPEGLLHMFLTAFLSLKICPRELKAEDERTYIFVKEFCDRLNIPVSIENNLPALCVEEYNAMEGLTERDEEGQIEDLEKLLDMMLLLGNGEIPQDLGRQIGEMVKKGNLPDYVVEKLDEYFHFDDGPKLRVVGKEEAGKNQESLPGHTQSYVISVSLGPGCYRHIRISGEDTLWDLHRAIIEAFEFDDDHAHAFFMDNKMWSRGDSYYIEGTQGERSTNRYKLRKVGLEKGKQFKYVFDFGDEWRFQCKVLRVLEEDTPEPAVIKSKGEAPMQYEFSDDDF